MTKYFSILLFTIFKQKEMSLNCGKETKADNTLYLRFPHSSLLQYILLFCPIRGAIPFNCQHFFVVQAFYTVYFSNLHARFLIFAYSHTALHIKNAIVPLQKKHTKGQPLKSKHRPLQHSESSNASEIRERKREQNCLSSEVCFLLIQKKQVM